MNNWNYNDDGVILDNRFYHIPKSAYTEHTEE